MEETLFYVFGGTLVVLAVVASAIGLRAPAFPGSRGLLAGTVLLFAVLVGATATYSVLNAEAEEEERAEEAAHEEAAHEEAPEATQPSGGGGEQGGGDAGGAASTVKVSSPADGSLSFEPSSLTASAGAVTIEYDNPSPVPHNVAIEQGGTTLAESQTGADGTFTATADLQAGDYVFFCAVPGHRESGMEGTLTVE